MVVFVGVIVVGCRLLIVDCGCLSLLFVVAVVCCCCRCVVVCGLSIVVGVVS